MGQRALLLTLFSHHVILIQKKMLADPWGPSIEDVLK
jgi:hypothetical protein